MISTTAHATFSLQHESEFIKSYDPPQNDSKQEFFSRDQKPSKFKLQKKKKPPKIAKEKPLDDSAYGETLVHSTQPAIIH